ncbi:MAG: hypothetical protein WED09_08530 [Homoserinimonas sp.]
MPRALSRVVSAVAAEGLGVQSKAIRVELSDERGALAVSVSTNISVMEVRKTRRDAEYLRWSGESLLDRSERTQQLLRARVATLTGLTVGHITIRLTGATMRPEARVR